MWKTKYASYMYQKRGIYYFSRRIPEDLKDYYKLSRIVISLRTRSENNALRQSKIIASKLEEDWQILRVKSSSEKLAGYLVGENLSIIPGIETKQDSQDQAPLLSEAARFYMETKGMNRPKVFRQSIERAVKYLLQTLDDKPISHYSRSEVNAFRDRLFERGLALASVKRNLNVVRAIVNFSSRKTGIPANSVFSGIYLGEQASLDNDKKRKPIPIHVIKNIQADCCRTDDEIRWLIALISDTGLRLSEAAGSLLVGRKTLVHKLLCDY